MPGERITSRVVAEELAVEALSVEAFDRKAKTSSAPSDKFTDFEFPRDKAPTLKSSSHISLKATVKTESTGPVIEERKEAPKGLITKVKHWVSGHKPLVVGAAASVASIAAMRFLPGAEHTVKHLAHGPNINDIAGALPLVFGGIQPGPYVGTDNQTHNGYHSGVECGYGCPAHQAELQAGRSSARRRYTTEEPMDPQLSDVIATLSIVGFISLSIYQGINALRALGPNVLPGIGVAIIGLGAAYLTYRWLRSNYISNLLSSAESALEHGGYRRGLNKVEKDSSAFKASALKEHEICLNKVEKYLKHRPEDITAKTIRHMLSFHFGQYDDAINGLEKIIQDSEEPSKYLSSYGSAPKSSGETAFAILLESYKKRASVQKKPHIPLGFQVDLFHRIKLPLSQSQLSC